MPRAEANAHRAAKPRGHRADKEEGKTVLKAISPDPSDFEVTDVSTYPIERGNLSMKTLGVYHQFQQQSFAKSKLSKARMHDRVAEVNKARDKLISVHQERNKAIVTWVDALESTAHETSYESQLDSAFECKEQHDAKLRACIQYYRGMVTVATAGEEFASATADAKRRDEEIIACLKKGHVSAQHQAEEDEEQQDVNALVSNWMERAQQNIALHSQHSPAKKPPKKPTKKPTKPAAKKNKTADDQGGDSGNESGSE